jgi:hypothetical protein
MQLTFTDHLLAGTSSTSLVFDPMEKSLAETELLDRKQEIENEKLSFCSGSRRRL